MSSGLIYTFADVTNVKYRAAYIDYFHRRLLILIDEIVKNARHNFLTYSGDYAEDLLKRSCGARIHSEGTNHGEDRT